MLGWSLFINGIFILSYMYLLIIYRGGSPPNQTPRPEDFYIPAIVAVIFTLGVSLTLAGLMQLF
jgi:hypothetical protein